MVAKILSNSSWNFAAFTFTVLANVMTIPFVIRGIGLSAFGHVGLLLGIIAPLSLIGTVIGQATVRAVSDQHRATDRRYIDDALWAAWLLGAAACAVVTLLFSLAAGVAFDRLADDETRTSHRLLPLVVALGWMAQQLALILQSAFAGDQRYRSIAAATTIGTVFTVAGVLIGVRLEPSALGYASGLATGLLLSLLTWLAWTVSAFPRALRPRAAERVPLRAIIAFGRWQSVAHLVGAAGLQADRYLLGLWAPLRAVGQYSVAVRLQEVVHMAVLKISEVLFPHFGATAAESGDRRAEFFVRSSWLVGVVTVTAMAPLIPLAQALLTLWVGVDAAQAGAPVLRTLVTASMLGAGATVYFYQALGTGRSNELAVVNIAHAVLTSLAAVPFVHRFGLAGAGLSIFLANAIRLPVCWHLAWRHFEGHLRLQTLWHLAGTPLLAGITAGWFAETQLSLVSLSWLSFAAWYATLALAAALLAVTLTSAWPAGRSALRAVLHRPAAVRA